MGSENGEPPPRKGAPASLTKTATLAAIKRTSSAGNGHGAHKPRTLAPGKSDAAGLKVKPGMSHRSHTVALKLDDSKKHLTKTKTGRRGAVGRARERRAGGRGVGLGRDRRRTGRARPLALSA